MMDADFPDAKPLGEAILEDPAYPLELKDLLFESLRLHRLIVGRDLPAYLLPRRLDDGSWILPGIVFRETGEEEVRPRVLLKYFMSTTQRFEIALHRELVFGRLSVRGSPVDRPEEHDLISREMWDVLTPTLEFTPVTRGAANDPGFVPEIGARGEKSEFRLLKPVPLGWVPAPREGLAQARGWMAKHVANCGSWKRQSAISACCKATGCTTREAEAAWMELPQSVRGRPGKPKQNRAMV